MRTAGIWSGIFFYTLTVSVGQGSQVALQLEKSMSLRKHSRSICLDIYMYIHSHGVAVRYPTCRLAFFPHQSPELGTWPLPVHSYRTAHADLVTLTMQRCVQADIICPARLAIEIHSSGFATSMSTYEAFRMGTYFTGSAISVLRFLVDSLFFFLATFFFISDMHHMVWNRRKDVTNEHYWQCASPSAHLTAVHP